MALPLWPAPPLLAEELRMTQAGKRTALYNPSLLRRDELIGGFVARTALLDYFLDDLRRGGRQHHLLIGARGAGKTTLLLRLAYAIDDDEQLSKHAIALRFPEEQYNVARLSDLWLNCLDALVDALEQRGQHQEAAALDELIASLEELEEGERQRRSLDELTRWAKRAGKLVVLLVDNLDIILSRLSEHHWALREVLSQTSELALIGASSTFLEEAHDDQSAFYDFFNVHELGALDEEEAKRMMLRLTERSGSARVAEVLEREPGRFKALLLLSGGTPRTLMMLHGILTEGSTTRAEEDLEAMLDQVTPYYKARFDDLSPQSQQVVDAVALHWHPITAAECDQKIRIGVNATSALLNRLTKQGVLSKQAGSTSSKLTFQIRERFFGIWYLMRASRRLRRRLTWLVGFLQRFYGGERASISPFFTPPASLLDQELFGVQADCISDSGMEPLYQALSAGEQGELYQLPHLAPEIRAPAEQILHEWRTAAAQAGALVPPPRAKVLLEKP